MKIQRETRVTVWAGIILLSFLLLIGTGLFSNAMDNAANFEYKLTQGWFDRIK